MDKGETKMTLHPRKTSRMFSFITNCWNPIGGKCSHDCVYCWAKAYAHRLKMIKYQGKPRVDEKQINYQFFDGDFVFVQDMSDLFAKNVPSAIILRVLPQIRRSPYAKFLLLTKNPKRYHDFEIPSNCVCGATIETDYIEAYGKISKAPDVRDRIYWMKQLKHAKMVSIEPTLNFNPNSFLIDIKLINPEFVAIGFDNYNNHLPEPETLKKVTDFIEQLEAIGIKVYRKTLREPHREKKQQ